MLAPAASAPLDRGAGGPPLQTMPTLSESARLLRDYIAIPSVNPMGRKDVDARLCGETRYAERVREGLSRLGVDSVLVGQGDRKSVVGQALASSPRAETLMVASHLDTVPIDSMTIDPFDPVVERGRMYGRGSCDTKAGLAALMVALERVLSRGTLRRNVIVVGEADEEKDSVGVGDVLEHLAGRRADFAVVTEPTEMKLVVAHKGTAIVRAEARGQACHSSGPEHGRNAIVAMARAIDSLGHLESRFRQRVHPLLGRATLSVGLIGGGQSPNIVPDRCWVVTDRRTLPGETEEGIADEIREQWQRDRIEGVELVEVRLGKQPLSIDPASPAALRCLDVLQRCGCAAEVDTVAFATDAGLFAAQGIPSLVLGPGSIRQAHTDREWVPLDQVDIMASVYERLLEDA